MTHKIKKKLLAGGSLCGISLFLLSLAHTYQNFANWYSDHIYQFLVNTIGKCFGIFPFSVSEFGLYLLLIFLLVSFIRLCRKTFQKRSDWKLSWCSYGSTLFLLASILFFLYTTNCGINYGRASFSETTNMNYTTYSVDDLKEVCLLVTEELNTLAEQVPRTEEGIALMDADTIPSEARNALLHLGTIYPELDGYYPVAKGLTVPYILSVQQLSGIYSPFTIEANYNSAMVEYNLPFTACHELSHLRGFMQEQEANFLAYLACINYDNVPFQYSGYLLGWIYTTNQLYRADSEAYQEVAALLNPLIRIDLRANSEFWDKYDGAIAELSDEVNDTYLKANGQSDGVQSYGRMVDLMIAYYKTH